MSNNETHYKELPLFNDITDSGHRAWNRLNIITNLKEDGRPHDAAKYLEKLNKADQLAVGLLLIAIKKKGIEKVKAELNRSIPSEKLGV